MANLDSFIRKQRAARSEQVKSSEDPRNAQARGEAILNALIAEGYEITDDQYGEMLAQYMNTGRMSMPEPQAAVQEEAPVAPAAPTLPQEEAVQPRGLYDLLTQSTRTPVDALMGDGYFDALVDTAQSGVQNSVRAAVGRMAASENPLVKGAANVAGAMGDLAQGDLESYILRTGGAKDGTAQDMSELAAASKANREAATPAREALGSRGWLIRNLGEGTLDAASSPSSAASLIGGPVGAISIVDAYDQAYQQAADAGIDSKEDREMWALSQAAPELVSLLPASKVLQKLPVIGKVIDRAIKKPFTSLAARIVEREGSPALKALAKTVNSSLGESLEEGFTGGLQDVAAGVAANVEGPLQELGRNTASSTFGGRAENGTFGDKLFESARAGFIMGGGLSAPSNVTGAYADRANFIDEKSSETEDSILAGLERARPALPETSDTINVPPVSEQMQTFGMDEPNVDRELFNAEQDIQADETKTRSLEEAFSRREEEEALQQAVEEEAGFRTMELQNNAQGPMAEKLREAGVALEVTPEQVAQEVLVADAQKKREAGAEAKRQAELDAQAARVAEINRIAQRRKARGDTAAKKAADEKKKVQTKAAILRTKAVDQLMDEGLEDHQIADALPARIKELTTAAEAVPTAASAKRAAPQPTINKKKPAKAAPRVPKDADLEKLKASSDPMDRLQAEAIEGGLNQVGSKAKDADTPDYRKKVKKIARLLAGDSSDRAAAVEKLIKQGKIVIAPNEAAVGRKPAEGYVREGEHDTDTGVTYIYTDSMDGDSNPLPAIMEATSHETTHLAQFSPRDARSEQMRGLIGDWGVNSGAKIIRKAAAKGNKFAQEALRRAENDTRIRREAGESNPDRFEDLELVAYAVGHENKGRTNSLGSASGAVRDAVAGVKQTLRKKLGLNLDVSVGDLRSVMGKVLQEGVETEARGAKGEGSLDMILPARAAKAAPQDRLYVDPVDGETKFVISDADSAITANPDKIRNIAKGVPITTVMSHDVLYDQIPEIRDTRLEQLSGEEAKRLGAEAVAEENLIRINPTIVEEAALGIELGDRRGVGRLRETLLHETQHIVQSKGEGSTGGSPAMFFTPADLKKVQLHHKALRELADGAAALVLAADARVGDSLLDTAGDVANDVLSNPNKYDKHTVGLAEDFAASEGKANTMEKMVDAIWKKWDADYKQIQGEREAYWTELNRNKPLDELPINPTAVPFEQGGLPGTNDRASAVRRDAEGNMWLTPSRAARGTGESLNMVSTSTPSFQQWFGNSKVVDENGDPKIMFTGTSKDTNFKAFKVPKNGVWFTDDPEVASSYAVDNDSRGMKMDPQPGKPWNVTEVNTSSRVFPVYLKAENPYQITPEDLEQLNRGRNGNYRQSQAILFDKLRGQGYDSVFMDSEGSTVVVLKEPTQIKSVNNSGEFSPASKDILNMVSDKRPEPVRSFRNRNKFTTALVANLANSRGLGKAVRNEVELAKSAPVEFEEKANRAVGRYERGITSLAADRGVSPESLNDQIRDELEEAYATKGSPSEKKAAFHAVTAKYGEAGAALNELRGLVDDLSAGLVRTYLDQGGKLSPDVATDVSKIVSNLGGYVHRFYAARQGQGAGQMYRSAVEAAVAKAQNKGVDKLTKGEQKLVTRYNNAMKRILNDVIIPSEADMQEMSAPDLDYLYQVWFGPDQGLDRDGKIARLAELDVDTAAMRRQAERLTKEALHGVENSPINVRYSPGQKINTTIMQERTAIPKEIRELLGEITDPAGALLTTVSKQAEFLARTKLMLSLQEMASPNDLQPPTAGGSEYVRDNNMTVLSGEGFGPLNGWFASPSMRAMLDDTREHLQNFVDAATVNKDAHAGAFEAGLRGIGKLWMQGASKAKAANIIGNVFRYPLNFVGSFGMLGINGNMNVKTWGEGFADALRIIRYTANPAAGLGKAADVVKYGVVDSATVGDLKLLDSGKIERLVREMSGKNPRSLMRTARKVGMTVRETYAMMDVWSKIANFHAEVDYLTALYKDEGTPKTKDAIMREAADIVNFTNMTYSRTMPLIKSIERGGITQYGPYLYEAHRVLITNMLRGAYEVYNAKNFSSPKAKARAAAHGTKRMMGTMATLGAIKFATDALAALTFGDDEEDKRMALPEFARVMDFLPMGRNEDGKPILWGASALDPFGPATDLYRRARLGDDPFESIVEQFKENYIAPSLFGSLVDALAVTGGKQPVFRKTRNSIVKQWMPDGWTDPLMNRLSPGNIDRVNAWANLLETRYLPGTARAWNDNNPKAETGAGAAVWNIARGMGARGLLVDPAVGGQSAGFEYDDKLTNIRDGLKTVIRNTDNLTPERATSVVLELRAEEKEAWDKLRSTYNGMLALGLEEAEARASLVNGGVSKKVAKSVSNGEFQSQVINEQSIKQTADRAVAKKKTKAEQEKEQAKWDAAWEVLDAIEGGE